MPEEISLLDKYNESIETLDMPGWKGTSSMFNPYVVFSLHSVGENKGGSYNYTRHFDGAVANEPDQPSADRGYTDTSPAPEPSATKKKASDRTPTTTTNPDKIKKNIQFYLDSLGASARSTQADSNTSNPNPALYITPTAKNIIDYNRNVTAALGYGPAPYSWADFLYCKYYGKIPNNRLITLRRYPYPAMDNATVPNANAALPVAQAVTWFSEETGNKLGDIMKMTFGVNWKEVEAEVQSVDGNEQAFGSGPEAVLGAKPVSALGAVLTMQRGSRDLFSGRQQQQQDWAKKAWTNEGPYWNQIYGPVNVVTKSHMRDRGVKFEQEITLNFHFNVRSIQGVNPKVAMLDLITNFLILSYTNAKFWGGATRYFPNASIRVGFLGDQKRFYSGDFKGYAQSLGLKLKEGMKQGADALKKLLSGNFSSLLESLGNLLGDNMSEKSMPQALSIRSMLSGDPVGEWHLTVGNPMNPIAVIGNLIMMPDTVMTFGETLGADDFPTEVTFTVKLKPGKPRDKGDIESMFNSGMGRMTYAPYQALSSQNNTFARAKTAAGKGGDTEAELLKILNGENANGEAGNRIQKRVRNQWGETFSDNNANLVFFINSSKMRF